MKFLPILVSELDVSARIMPVLVEKDCASLWLLVRCMNKTLGKTVIPGPFQIGSIVSTQQIENAIFNQVGKEILQFTLLNKIFRYANKKNPAIQNTPISIIVCTRNRPKQLSHCIEKLLALQYDTFEIIIVDNAPDNNDTFDIAAGFPVRYVREDCPGLNRARNRGISEAQYNIIAFTDDDTCVDRFWLQEISLAFDDAEVMAASGFVAPYELETKAQYIFECGYGGMGHGFKKREFLKPYLTSGEMLWASNFGIGANMAFRKTVFEKIGNFDPALDVGTPSGGGGDIEMFHRIVTHGFKMVYEPSMLIWHKHRAGIPDLKKQIFNNGCGFGCYLIDCLKKKTVKRTAILKFVLMDWLIGWNLKNFLNPSNGLSRSFTLMELRGFIKSPTAYKSSQLQAKTTKEEFIPLEH